MVSRRGFLADALAATGAGRGALAGLIAADFHDGDPKIHAGVPAREASSASEMVRTEQLLDQNTIKAKGHFFEATVPDTLDLAERARLCVNVLTQNMEPTQHYGVYQAFKFGRSPFQLRGLTWNLPGKNARVLPLLRTMCGSDFNLDIECNLMAELLSDVDAQGMRRPSSTTRTRCTPGSGLGSVFKRS